jgi:hypothetical protein
MTFMTNLIMLDLVTSALIGKIPEGRMHLSHRHPLRLRNNMINGGLVAPSVGSKFRLKQNMTDFALPTADFCAMDVVLVAALSGIDFSQCPCCKCAAKDFCM